MRLILKGQDSLYGSSSELERLLDHFNVDVNNPINVMTQDSSRQFLQSGSAKARRLS
jgi:hypothetical protein